MPVDRSHGALHAVIVCQIPLPNGASWLVNVIVWPAFTVGTALANAMSPCAYTQSTIGIAPLTGSDGALVRSWYLSPDGCPPWLSFSGRWPWVNIPATATSVVNGSAPAGVAGVASAIHTTMMPIDSYHDARAESYVAEIDSWSPLCTATAHDGGVAVIATSHDTAPAGSK